MTHDPSTGTDLQPGEPVCIFPGLRKHSSDVRIDPTEVCVVVELPSGAQPADAVAVRRPNGDLVWVDDNMVGRMRR